MQTRTDKIEGPFRVTEDLTLHGMVTGDTTVASGVFLNLHGLIGGNLRIEPEARVNLHGVVGGSVTNCGFVEVAGMIVGSLTDADGGESVVKPGAMIRNERR